MRKKRVAEHYDRLAKYYDGFSFLKRLFEFRLYVGTLKYLKSGDAVLDVGCGTGNMSFELAAKFKRVYGVDISMGMLNLAKLKKIFEKRLQSLRRQFSNDLDSEKLLGSLSNAEKHERRDILGLFFRFLFNNSVFVYQKQDNKQIAREVQERKCYCI